MFVFAQNPAIFALDSETDNYNNDENYFFQYDVNFAKKYHLSLADAKTLPSGLIAIELAVAKERFFKEGVMRKLFPNSTFADDPEMNLAIPALEVIYRHKKKLPVYYYNQCYLNLYVTDDVMFDYPENGNAADNILSKKVLAEGMDPIKTALISQNKENDFLNLIRTQEKTIAKHYYSHAYIVEKNQMYYPKNYRDLVVSRYEKNIFPGGNFIQFGPDIGCQMLSELKSNPIVLLLKKANSKEINVTKNKLSESIVSEYFYVFPLPRAVVKNAP